MGSTDRVPEMRHLILDDPERRNPVTPQFVTDLRDALADEVDAIVISAGPGTVFSAGGDLRLGTAGLSAMSAELYKTYETISTSASILIVAANGLALGAGAQLVLASDIRFVGPEFALRCTDLTTGLAAGMWALPADVGRGRALDLLLSGRTLSVAEAREWGLVDRVVEDPVGEALGFAAAAMETAPSLRRRIKQGVAASSLSSSAIRDESAAFKPPSPPTGTGHD